MHGIRIIRRAAIAVTSVGLLLATAPAAAEAATTGDAVAADNPTSLSGFQNTCPAGQHVEIFAYASGRTEFDWAVDQAPSTPVHTYTFPGGAGYTSRSLITDMSGGYWSIHVYPIYGVTPGIVANGSGSLCSSG